MKCKQCGAEMPFTPWCPKCQFRPCEKCGEGTGAYLVKQCLACAAVTAR